MVCQKSVSLDVTRSDLISLKMTEKQPIAPTSHKLALLSSEIGINKLGFFLLPGGMAHFLPGGINFPYYMKRKESDFSALRTLTLWAAVTDKHANIHLPPIRHSAT